MTIGQWREGFPRVTLTLLGGDEPLALDFIVDTGEVLVLDGKPLLGNGLWRSRMLHTENRDSGEVFFESL